MALYMDLKDVLTEYPLKGYDWHLCLPSSLLNRNHSIKLNGSLHRGWKNLHFHSFYRWSWHKHKFLPVHLLSWTTCFLSRLFNTSSGKVDWFYNYKELQFFCSGRTEVFIR